VRGRAGTACFGWPEPRHEHHDVIRGGDDRQRAAERTGDLRVDHQVGQLAAAPTPARTHAVAGAARPHDERPGKPIGVKSFSA